MNFPARFLVGLRYLAFLALLALVLWAVANVIVTLSSGPGVHYPPGVVQAREIEGEDIDGIPFKLSDYNGKVRVLVFWGTW
jgi:hypothetical protein